MDACLSSWHEEPCSIGSPDRRSLVTGYVAGRPDCNIISRTRVELVSVPVYYIPPPPVSDPSCGRRLRLGTALSLCVVGIPLQAHEGRELGLASISSPFVTARTSTGSRPVREIIILKRLLRILRSARREHQNNAEILMTLFRPLYNGLIALGVLLGLRVA